MSAARLVLPFGVRLGALGRDSRLSWESRRHEARFSDLGSGTRKGASPQPVGPRLPRRTPIACWEYSTVGAPTAGSLWTRRGNSTPLGVRGSGPAVPRLVETRSSRGLFVPSPGVRSWGRYEHRGVRRCRRGQHARRLTPRHFPCVLVRGVPSGVPERRGSGGRRGNRRGSGVGRENRRGLRGGRGNRRAPRGGRGNRRLRAGGLSGTSPSPDPGARAR